MVRELPNLADTDLLKTLVGIHINAKLLMEAINKALATATDTVSVPVHWSFNLGVSAEGEVLNIYKQLGWSVEAINDGHKGRCIRLS